MNVAAQGMQTTQTCIPPGEQVMGGEPGRFLREIDKECVSRKWRGKCACLASFCHHADHADHADLHTSGGTGGVGETLER